MKDKLNYFRLTLNVYILNKDTYTWCYLFFLIAGCQNTPAKGTRYCEIHKDVAKELYVNDEIGVGNIASKSDKSTSRLLIVKVLNEKCTRQGKMFEVTVVIFLCGLNYFV